MIVDINIIQNNIIKKQTYVFCRRVDQNLCLELNSDDCFIYNDIGLCSNLMKINNNLCTERNKFSCVS
jgi:hypothetical protein